MSEHELLQSVLSEAKERQTKVVSVRSRMQFRLPVENLIQIDAFPSAI